MGPLPGRRLSIRDWLTRTPRGGMAAWLDALQAIFMAAAVVVCLRGGTQHVWALLLFLFVPAVRFASSQSYRSLVKQRTVAAWHACKRFSADPQRLPWAAACRLVVLPGALWLLANYDEDYGDNAPVMLAATSLATEGNWNVDEFLDAPGFDLGRHGGPISYTLRHGTSGHVYSNYPAGPVEFALPVAAAARLVGADLQRDTVHKRLQKWTAAVQAAVCLGLFFLIALHLVEAPAAAFVTLLLAAASALFTTVGQGLWQHGGIILWSLVAVLVEFRRREKPEWYHSWIQGFSLAQMLAFRLSAAAIILPFGVWLLVREPRRAFAVAGVAALAYVPWAALYLTLYGQPFGPSAGQMSQGCWMWGSFLDHLEGVLLSPARGVFVYETWLLLAVAVGLPFVRRLSPDRGPSGWQWFAAAAIGINLVLVSGWGMWWGGWCYGPRLTADTLPLWALLCVRPVAALWRSRAGRGLLVALLLVGFLVNAPAVYVGAGGWNGTPDDIDYHPSRLWSWSRPPFLHPFQAD